MLVNHFLVFQRNANKVILLPHLQSLKQQHSLLMVVQSKNLCHRLIAMIQHLRHDTHLLQHHLAGLFLIHLFILEHWKYSLSLTRSQYTTFPLSKPLSVQ